MTPSGGPHVFQIQNNFDRSDRGLGCSDLRAFGCDRGREVDRDGDAGSSFGARAAHCRLDRVQDDRLGRDPGVDGQRACPHRDRLVGAVQHRRTLRSGVEYVVGDDDDQRSSGAIRAHCRVDRSKMIVWGGVGSSAPLSDGSAYDPGTNSWTPISSTKAPSPRYLHSAIWTGSKMIVWGGWTSVENATPLVRSYGVVEGAGAVNTGAIYDPQTNSWASMSTVKAPTPRGEQVAVWTGSKMIVWGGDDGTSNDLNDGGIYDPATDTWTPTSLNGAPSARDYHAAVWSGSKMIVWGGYGNATADTNTGGVFDPISNTWTPTSVNSAPLGRSWPTAVWTGARMIIWGGYADLAEPPQEIYYSNGGLYDPVANGWSAMTTTGAPSGRFNHTSVWTGSQMITWGGFDSSGFVVNTGGVYTPPVTPCAPDGGRECVAPIAPGLDSHSVGRLHLS